MRRQTSVLLGQRVAPQLPLKRQVVSLKEWSSSLLISLYVSIWAYSSSGGQRSPRREFRRGTAYRMRGLEWSATHWEEEKTVRKQSTNWDKVASHVKQTRKHKIYGVISKWSEVLQGISHSETLESVVTRNGESFSPPISHPRLFDFQWCHPVRRSYFGMGHFALYGNLTSQTKHWDTQPEERVLYPFWAGQAVWENWNSRILEFPGYSMKSTGQNFLKRWNTSRNSGIHGHQTHRLESLFRSLQSLNFHFLILW